MAINTESPAAWPLFVVDAFEVVHIEHHDRHRTVVVPVLRSGVRRPAGLSTKCRRFAKGTNESRRARSSSRSTNTRRSSNIANSINEKMEAVAMKKLT